MMINKKQNYILTKEVLHQQIDADSILLDMKSENYFGLNEAGSHILKKLQNGSNLETLVKHLLPIYEVDEHQLENDISELIEALLKAKLIVAT